MKRRKSKMIDTIKFWKEERDLIQQDLNNGYSPHEAVPSLMERLNWLNEQIETTVK